MTRRTRHLAPLAGFLAFGCAAVEPEISDDHGDDAEGSWADAPPATGLADLRVPVVSLDASEGAAGDVFTVHYTRWNNSDTDAGPFGMEVRFYTSVGGHEWVHACDASVDGMVAGAAEAKKITTCTIPADLAPGDWYVGVCADAWEEVEEASETNNLRWDMTAVTVQ